MKNEIVLFTDGDVNIEVQINPEQETVWLTQKQMELLFDVKHATVSEHIFVWFYAGYGINVTGVNGREIIILFSICRHAHSCTFISVIELPRIPAYCPKTSHTISVC